MFSSDEKCDRSMVRSVFRCLVRVFVSLVGGGKILAGGEANSDGAFTIDVKVNLSIGLYTIKAVGSENSEATAPLLVVNKE